MNIYYIYMLTNWNNEVLYIGITNNLERRIYEHKHKLIKGFSAKYNLTKLVYIETTHDVNAAIAREKQLKKWRREKKDNLIESINPLWDDLDMLLLQRYLPSLLSLEMTNNCHSERSEESLQ